MMHIETTLGPKHAGELGIILPHEHVILDLRGPDAPGFGQAAADDVIRLMAPEFARAKEAGVTAIVETTAVGGGRRPDLLRALSLSTGVPIVVPTGVFREPWIAEWAQRHAEEELRDWMVGELREDIEGSGVRAGWIKLRSGDDGLSEAQAKLLRAAAAAGAATGAVIGSHTIRGRVAHQQIDVIEKAGYRPDRFIWIHTQEEPDLALHLEVARRGAWIEYDGIGEASRADDVYVDRILRILDAGLEARLLLSHDRGWFDPGQPGGGTPRPYTHLFDNLLPALRRAGVDEPAIRRLTEDNPFRALARHA
jgi:phosphotriesterase-related protein